MESKGEQRREAAEGETTERTALLIVFLVLIVLALTILKVTAG
jgi:hypothetical protein